MRRREFLGMAAGALAGGVPIIDAHIHLFDPRRPQGVPWPPKDDRVLYRPALPERYRQIAAPLGITGAIEVECSPWVEDNQWVLDVAEKDPIIVGMVGNLEPGSADFGKQLERFRKNALFLGIRYGNLWGRDLAAGLAKPAFVDDLKRLAAGGLELDSANPNPALLAALLRVTDLVPRLRIVIDHLPQLVPPGDGAARADYYRTLRELAARRQVYVKVSEVFRRVDGKVIEDPAYYRGTLDEMWETFGEDRLIYGSDWPNSDHWKPYPDVLRIVHDYFTAKGAGAAEKYFWKNSAAAYRWKRRAASTTSSTARWRS